MSDDRWQRVVELYQAAQERAPEERLAFVRQASHDDSGLRREVESLLAQDEKTVVLDRPIAAAAHSLLADNAGVQPGSFIGSYRIDGLLGVGGMGEVYRAHDTKLNRDVAIKILPPAFATDPDRLARFKREAQVLASLNHPNIASIHGFEDSGAVHALVLELVEGPTLADRIARGALPVDESLKIAKQLAEALEAAHEQGIVHRDLKPANIKVRDDGTVKVLDFGLAKLADPIKAAPQGAPSMTQSPTITTPAMTQAGMILGTAAYMSPEQAKGKPADKRSDIWAFGCVLYEMLTGKRAFDGEDVSDTLAFILTRDPDWTALPADMPPSIRKLLRGCLQKDLRKRLPHLGVARLEIEAAADDLDEERDNQRSESGAPARPLLLRALPIIAASVLAVAATTAVMLRLRPAALPPLVARFSIPLRDGQQFSTIARGSIALSPDGTELAYLADDGLFVRKMADSEATRIGSVETLGRLTSDPVFSPDGQSLLFYVDGALKRISLNGGAAVPLARIDAPPDGVDWSDSGIVWALANRGVFRVAGEGGTPEQIVKLQPGEQIYGPQLLQHGEQVLFTLTSGADRDRWDLARIVVQSIKTGERKTILEGGSDARYLPSGHLVYAVAGRLLSAPFDVDRLAVTRSGISVVEGVSRSASGIAHVSYSKSGSLIYMPGPVTMSLSQQRLAVFDRSGGVQPLKLPPGPYEFPRVSPDGQYLAVGRSDSKGAAIWIYDLISASPMRQLTLVGRNRFPVWSADSQYVTFQSDLDGDLGIFRLRADGSSAKAQRLTRAEPGQSHVPQAWTPSGEQLLFSVVKGGTVSLSILSLRGETKITPFGDVHSQIPTAATLSTDGRWVAYQKGAIGNNAIYVQPFPQGDVTYPILSGNAHHPRWSKDGRQLFFIPARSYPAIVNITMEPKFSFSDPVPFPGQRWAESGPGTERTYDLMPDGEHVVGFIDPQKQSENAEIRVVLNWSEELKQRVPTR